MIDERTLGAFCRGEGIAIAARQRWAVLPLEQNVTFVDSISLAALREAHPEWRATPLAPVRRVEDPLLLPSTDDGSIGFLVCFPVARTLAELDRLIRTAQRVLQPGGALVLAIPDERYVDEGDRAAAEAFAHWGAIERELEIGGSDRPWTAGRLAHAAATLLAARDTPFSLELAGRFGAEAVVVLQLPGAQGHRTGDLLEFASRVYVIDGGFVRHVQSPAVLEPLRQGSRSIRPIGEDEMRTLVIGRPVRSQDVEPLLARRSATA